MIRIATAVLVALAIASYLPVSFATRVAFSLIFLPPTESAGTWEVQFIRYYNRYSWTYWNNYGYCCDPYYTYRSSQYYYRYSTSRCRYYQCDNYFEFCIRSYGSTSFTSDSTYCSYGRKVTPTAGDDSFSFSSSSIGTSSSTAIDNPIVFTYTGSSSPVSSCACADLGAATTTAQYDTSSCRYYQCVLLSMHSLLARFNCSFRVLHPLLRLH